LGALSPASLTGDSWEEGAERRFSLTKRVATIARAIKAIDQSIVVVLTSTTHPDELPQEAHSLGDRIVWKGELRPRLLEEIWRRHRDGKGEDSLPSS